MKRVIFTLPFGDGLPVFGYGLFLMLGFVVGLAVAWRRARRLGISGDAALDVGLLSIFAGVVGARLAYLLVDYVPSDGRYGTPSEWLAVWHGGLTFQGGLALAVAADWLYLRWKKIPVARMFDAYAPSLAFGVGFGRIGCLLNGCCWGRPAPAGTLAAMTFPHDIEPMAAQITVQQHYPGYWHDFVTSLGYAADTAAPVPLYATQFVSALGLFAIGFGLMAAERIWSRRRDGQVVVWFLIAYAVGRFAVEYFRDDTPLRYGFGAFPGLRLGQWLALAMFAAGVLAQLYIWKQSRREAAPGRPAGGETGEDHAQEH